MSRWPESWSHSWLYQTTPQSSRDPKCPWMGRCWTQTLDKEPLVIIFRISSSWKTNKFYKLYANLRGSMSLRLLTTNCQSAIWGMLFISSSHAIQTNLSLKTSLWSSRWNNQIPQTTKFKSSKVASKTCFSKNMFQQLTQLGHKARASVWGWSPLRASLGQRPLEPGGLLEIGPSEGQLDMTWPLYIISYIIHIPYIIVIGCVYIYIVFLVFCTWHKICKS